MPFITFLFLVVVVLLLTYLDAYGEVRTYTDLLIAVYPLLQGEILAWKTVEYRSWGCSWGHEDSMNLLPGIWTCII